MRRRRCPGTCRGAGQVVAVDGPAVVAGPHVIPRFVAVADERYRSGATNSRARYSARNTVQMPRSIASSADPQTGRQVQVDDREHQDRQEHDGQHQHGQGQYLIQPLGCLPPPPRILTASFHRVPSDSFIPGVAGSSAIGRRVRHRHRPCLGPRGPVVSLSCQARSHPSGAHGIAASFTSRARSYVLTWAACSAPSSGRTSSERWATSLFPVKETNYGRIQGRKALVSADGAALC